MIDRIVAINLERGELCRAIAHTHIQEHQILILDYVLEGRERQDMRNGVDHE